MKIVCQACGAKYSIADEKVAGKTFKIRCKKCSEVIVVRGDQQDAAGAEAAVSSASATVWHVVVGGEQQGPFSPAQIGDMLASATIDWEAYVWREGFDNWLAARDVEELVNAVMGGDGSGEQATPEYESSASVDMPPAEPAYAEAAPPTAEPAFAAAAPAEAEAPVASRTGRRESVDLFAQAEESSSLFGAGSKEVDVPGADAPAGPGLTGSRNENSVLFSLSSLQANAGNAPAANAPGVTKGGTTEGSGLIDIRALSATALPSGAKPASGGRVDDLLALGAGNSAFGSALAAPTLTPIKQESGGNKAVILGAAAAVVLAVAGAAAFVATRGNDAPPPSAPVAAAPIAPAAAEAPPAPPPPPPAGEAAPAPAQNPSEGTTVVAAATPTKRDSEPRRTAPAPERSTASAPAAPPPAPARTSGSSSSSTRSGSATGGGNLDDLLNRALSAPSTPARSAPAAPAPAPAAASGPETPSQADVRAAIAAVQPGVTACSDGTHGLATTRIEFTGATGRVRNATVEGQFAGTPVGSCVARAVRAARVQPFTREVFSVSYPFRL